MTLVAFATAGNLTPIVITLIIGIVPGLVTAPLLLAVPGENATTLVIGRVLVWLQALAILVAAIIGIVIVVK